jgi:hypothetical protein
MKDFVKVLTLVLIFSSCVSCQSIAQEKTSNTYLSKMIDLANLLDSIVGSQDSFNCEEFTKKVNLLAENLFKDDSLLHSIDIALRDDSIIDACGGGYAQYWIFPQTGEQRRCEWTKTTRFETKNFGTCFFQKIEGTIPLLQKNGVEYNRVLNLDLHSDKRFKNKYSLILKLEVFIPTGGVF